MTFKKSHKSLIAIVIFALCMTGCSSEKEEQPVMHNEVRVLFTYEGFCGVGYNDIILAAIEKCSQQYNFEYSFLVPSDIESGMEDYRQWLKREKDPDVNKSLYIFASNAYESLLAQQQHPDPASGKDLLLFETEQEVPYAYTFGISYYGASYMIGCIYQKIFEESCDFNIIAANPHMQVLKEVQDGFQKSTEGAEIAKVTMRYLADEPGAGFDQQESAYMLSLLIENEAVKTEEVEILVPIAGASNLGVYRFSLHCMSLIVGVDYLGDFYSSTIILNMNKKMEWALSDFFSPWVSGAEISRHRFYTLESGRVEIVANPRSLFSVTQEDYDFYLQKAIDCEEEYYLNKNNQ